MTDENIDFHDELTRLTRADPFLPFTIATTSGARYFVPDSDWVIYTNDVVTLIRPRAGSIMIRVYSIESIELHELIR
jgi:hypothetical protein